MSGNRIRRRGGENNNTFAISTKIMTSGQGFLEIENRPTMKIETPSVK